MIKILAIIGASIAFYAGMSLISVQMVQQDNVLETISHGMGYYFIAQAIAILLTGWALDDIKQRLANNREAS